MQTSLILLIQRIAQGLPLLVSLVLFSSQAHAIGAIAVGNENQSGWSTGYDNIAEAEQRAVEECGSGCRALIHFQGCGAIAMSRSTKAIGGGPNRAAAEKSAFATCKKRTKAQCTVLVWACERPIR